MKLTPPAFDPRKFYRFRCRAAQVPKIFRTVAGLKPSLQAMRTQKRHSLLIGFGVLFAAFILVFAVRPLLLDACVALALLGFAYVYVTTLLRRLFFPEGWSRSLCFFLLLNPGCFIYIGVFAYWNQAVPSLTPNSAPLAVVLSTLVVFWLYQIEGALRGGRLVLQESELSHLSAVVIPLAADLPAGVTCELTFNPFESEFSSVKLPSPRYRPGYTYSATADILLDLKLPIDPKRKLRLTIHEYRVDKLKHRKNRYGGSKRTIVYRYELKLSGAAVDAAAVEARVGAQVESFRRLIGQAGAGGALKLTVRADRDALTVSQIFKSSSNEKGLRPDALLPASLVLETVRTLAAQSSRDQSP